MKDVDILAELRAWRDEFARSHGYDLAAMVATLRELDAVAVPPVVRREPRRPAGYCESGSPPRPPDQQPLG